MNVITLITLLQEHPALAFLLSLLFFAFMFSIKNIIVILYSRSIEKERQKNNQQEDN